MAITEDQKEEIRSKIDIADLVTSYGFQLKHSGSDLWCCCPFHTEKTPSFKVDSSRGTFHCFGCGESGDVFSFVMKMEGLSFGEAKAKLANIAGVELQKTINPTAELRKRLLALMSSLAFDFNRMLKSPKNEEGAKAREYLENRQLDTEIVNKFLIGYAPKDVERILAWASRHGYSYQDLAAAGVIKPSSDPHRKPYFYFANRLVFAIKDKNGQVVGFSGRQLEEDKKSGKYINSPETLLFKKSKNFFAYDIARRNIAKSPNREAIICEGQIDCIRLHANGFNTAIAPLGTAFTEDHAILLHRVADCALLCLDGDGAGHKATIKTARILLAEGMPVRIMSLPDGEDPDSFITKNGREAFNQLIAEKTESIVRFQIRMEQQKEASPTDSNAIVRVAKSVLETIAQCKDEVLKSVLLKEAAKILGIEAKSLKMDLADIAHSNENAENTVDPEQLIEPPKAGKAEEAGNLPGITEGAFINFVLSNETNNEIKSYVSKLLPLQVFASMTTRTIVSSWLKGATKEDDTIRAVIESLSMDEYKAILSILANLDPSQHTHIEPKNKIVYFARQIWHGYLLRLLEKFKDNDEMSKTIAQYIKKLHTDTIRGVVHLMTRFPHQKFER